MTDTNTVTPLVENIMTHKAEYVAKSTTLFKEVVVEFFESNPGLTAIVWAQYVPYFNDGDACEFTVSGPVFTNASADQLPNVSHYGEYEGSDEDDVLVLQGYNVRNKQYDGINSQSVQSMENLIYSGVLCDILQDLFGEHSIVVATREGFDVSEYDHD